VVAVVATESPNQITRIPPHFLIIIFHEHNRSFQNTFFQSQQHHLLAIQAKRSKCEKRILNPPGASVPQNASQNLNTTVITFHLLSPFLTLCQNANYLNAPFQSNFYVLKQNRHRAAIHCSSPVIREGTERVERRGGLLPLPPFPVTENRHERRDRRRESADGCLVDLDDGEAGDDGGRHGAAVRRRVEENGDEARDDALGDEADLGVVVEGEVEEKRQRLLLESGVDDGGEDGRDGGGVGEVAAESGVALGEAREVAEGIDFGIGGSRGRGEGGN